MISLLRNNAQKQTDPSQTLEDKATQADEADLIHLIYRFAGKKDEWFNLLLSLSNCISISESLPPNHPYQGVSERLLSHLKNAIKISTRLNTGSYTLLTSNTLDQLPIPAGVLDCQGRVVEINQLALDIIQQLPACSIQNHTLAFEHIDIKEHIHNLIHSEHDFSTLSTTTPSTTTPSTTHSNFSGINRLYLSQIPNESHPEKPYIYICFNHQKSSFIEPETLKSDYALTNTEALIVLTLLEGTSSSSVAKRLKLKDATVRGHLTNIYSKVGVTRKPDLVRKIMFRSLSHATKNTHFFDENPAKNITYLHPASQQHVTSTLTLEDGRRLSYLDLSSTSPDDATHTLLVLHNLMGSAFELPTSAQNFIEQHSLRIIIPERPGYGDSCQHQGRTHKSFCQDIKQLLDHLAIPAVKVIAHSIGGAYALAMAEFIPHRIERIAMVNAITRLEDMLQSQPVPVLVSAVHKSLRFAPFLIEPILKMAVGKDLEHFYSQQLNYMRPTKEGRAADMNLLSQPDFRQYSLKNLKQSSKQGIQVWSEELKLSFSEWPFDVTNQSIEYQFWHGDEDDVISINAAIRLANELNTKSFFRLKYETHYLFSRHFQEVIQELIAPNQQGYEHIFQSIAL